MKISEDTLSILGNFSTIQGSIVVDAGSVISSVSEDRCILVKAVVDETFPKKFGIYDLNEFLNASSLVGDSPVFDFEDDFVFILSSDSSRSIRYTYSDPSLLSSCIAPKEMNLPTEDFVRFDLSGDNIKSIKKSSGVLNLPHVAFNTTNGGIYAYASVKSSKSKNEFDISIPTEDFDSSTNFICTFDADLLKLYPGDYIVTVYKAGICHFAHETIELEYFIAPQKNYSSFN